MAYIDWEQISLRVTRIIKEFNKSAKYFDETGAKVLDPKKSRRFFITDDNSMISLDDEEGDQIVRFYLSGTQSLDDVDRFIETLRNSIKKIHPNIEFDTRKFTKEITPKDFADNVEREVKERRDIKTFRDIVNEMLFKS